jgi:two-component system CheB/CheR fusion protein
MAREKSKPARSRGKRKRRTGEHAAPAKNDKSGAHLEAPLESASPADASAKPFDADAFPVVGIGASAGGLEAFTQFIQELPVDTGMAFVLVQHLDPKHESMLPEIVARSTALPIIEVAGPIKVEPNSIYIARRATNVHIERRVLYPTPRQETGEPQMPIDHFLRSLATDLGNKAIGVILSGTGTDGSLGLKAVKAEGGITFAQDEETAKYDGMPRNAVASGCVDFVLAPGAMVEELARIGQHPYVSPPKPAPPEEVIPVSDNLLMQILTLVRVVTGVDLIEYKPNTIKRRILRRMLLHKIESLDEYLERLEADQAEVRALYEDILINVTQFFRDSESFEAVKSVIFPKIVAEQPPGSPIRVWVPGCSTGEEVYSLAICLLEYLEERVNQAPVQLFGTDISEHALEKARTGLYGENITADVSPERLKRFFLKVDRGYQISKRIRDVCVFARQDLSKDPPFSKLDLISCRNVLIYLSAGLQRRVLPVFHYALKPRGFLLLGNSETIGAYAEIFAPVDKKHKIFAKRTTGARPALHFSHAASAGPRSAQMLPKSPAAVTISELQKEADRVVLARFGPPGVVINDDLDIVQFRGQTGMFLEPPPGPATYNILKLAREGLLTDLRIAIQKARSNDAMVRRLGAHVKYNGDLREVDLEVVPIQGEPQGSRFFLVLFHARPLDVKQPGGKGSRRQAGAQPQEFKRLRDELAATKESLQAIIEEQEASNEELRSANEEIQSSNEELQSTNEELETAKEELQSSNEELNTVNEELENRNTQLSQVNDDLRNLLGSVNLPIVMVDNDLRIRRFTLQAEKALSLNPSDLGRPIGNIRSNFDIPNLEQLLMEVIESLRTHESEVQDVSGRWYSMRIRPYRTEDNKIEGAVLTLVEIDQLKRALEQARDARDFNQSVIETVRSPLLVLDSELRVKMANPSFHNTFQLGPQEVADQLIYDLGGGQFNLAPLRSLLEELLPKKGRLQDFEIEQDFPRVGRKTMFFNARRFRGASQHSEMVLLSIEDVTERKRAEELIMRSQAELEGRVQQRTAELQQMGESLRESERSLLDKRSELSLNARLITAHEEERRRISRELRDALSQKLALLEMDVENLESKPRARRRMSANSSTRCAPR